MNIFPPAYQQDIYLSLHADLQAAHFSAEGLYQHYLQHGIAEGRNSNALRNRADFAALVPETCDTLELYPFFTPCLKGTKVQYFDKYNRGELSAKASEFQQSARPPQIDHVNPDGDLSTVDTQFEYIFENQTLTKHPDLVGHLQAVEGLMKPGGHYLVVIKDKRYSSNYYLPETSAAEIIAIGKLSIPATRRLQHTIEHYALTTHNDPVRHWNGDHGPKASDFASRYKVAMAAYDDGNSDEVHAYHFTPDSFADTMKLLYEAQLTTLQIVRNYHTRHNQAEFFVIMEKQ